MTTSAHDSLTIYMAYLLRYVPHFPITIAELQKMATTRHFSRLARYLGELPPDHTYQNAKEALDHFKSLSQQANDNDTN